MYTIRGSWQLRSRSKTLLARRGENFKADAYAYYARF